MTETIDCTNTLFAKKGVHNENFFPNYEQYVTENTEIPTKKKRKSNDGKKKKESYAPKSLNQRTYVSYLKSTSMPLVIAF